MVQRKEEMGASASPTALSSQAIEPASQSRPSGLQSTGAWTPGPWKVFHTTDGRTILGVGDRDGGGITDTGDVSTNDQGVWRSGKEKEANARLIAAAPDLYEALALVAPGLCKSICPYGGTGGEQNWPHDPICQQVTAALNKASGK